MMMSDYHYKMHHPQLEQNLMSLLELTLEKVIKLQKNDTFCKNIIQYIDCSKYNNYFIDTRGILHKKVIDFNSTFSAVVILQMLIKYLLHASHDSLGHVGATKVYHLRHEKKNTSVCEVMPQMLNYEFTKTTLY